VAAVHVFLIRHGETALNAAGVLRGQLDVPLTKTGEAEASALGGLFREVPLRAILSSPLRRAADTARPMAPCSGGPLEIDDRLTDRFYGEWAGHPLEQVEERFGSIDAAPFVEAWQLLEARAEDAFSYAVAAAEAGAARNAGAARDAGGSPREDLPLGAALVTHDAVLRSLLGRLLPASRMATLELPTGSWSELVSSPGKGWRALHLGEVPANGCRPVMGGSSGRAPA